MKKIKVSRFIQDPAHCAVAACASLINYYNPDVDYEEVKTITNDQITDKVSEEGLDAGQMGKLLNLFGFKKITYVSTDLNFFDYSWKNYKKKKMIEMLRLCLKKKEDDNEKEVLQNIYEWYIDERYDNQIKIDLNFGKYIRNFLDQNKPVILSFNWNMFMEFPKWNEKGELDSINGSSELHAVLANGYDKKYINIVDSHVENYKYKRKKYRSGMYKIPWENLFICMGSENDLILAEDYQV